MKDKPTILFISIIHPGFVHYHAKEYGLKRIFDILPHKQAILALVAWLREKGCEGHYIWFDFDKVHTDEGTSRLDNAISEHKPDAIGFSLCTEEMNLNYELIKVLKEKYPDLPVIVGGPHVSALTEETLRHFNLIDYVAIGEGEKTITEWLKKITEGQGKSAMRDVKGLAFRDDSGEIVRTPTREKVPDLNMLPDPAWDLIFEPKPEGGQDVPFPLVCSYGCYFHCTFCSAEHENYRYLNPTRVVDQIELGQKKYGARYFAIRDSFWPPTGEWLDEFCTEVEKRGLDIEFHFSTRVGTLSEKQLERLKRLGAKATALGIEAGDPEILKAIKKGITLDQARQTAKAMNKVGIFTVAFFIFGNQGETRETIQSSIKFARELNTSIAQFNILAPFPGAEVYGYLPDDEKDWWLEGRASPSICELTPAELEDIARVAFLRYTIRWSYLRQHVFGGKLDPEFKRICKRLFSVHFRKYVLGMAERFWLARVLIRGVKKVLGRN
jgi:anaerobic magnesium-protoporphyrin IX monomethyl ester cyclase